MSNHTREMTPDRAVEPGRTGGGTGPSLATVIVEQLAVVGLAVRREALAAAVVFAMPIVILLFLEWSGQGRLVFEGDFPPSIDPAESLGYLAALAGLLFPLLVWKGEARFGDTTLWTLPVDHRLNALAKVGAGWVWLLAIGLVAMGLVAVAVVAAGGSLGGEQVRVIVRGAASTAGGTGSIEEVVWATPWWAWVLPFTTGTAAYLVSSVLLLGTAQPWWWAGGAWLFILAIGLLSEEANIGWLSGPWTVISRALDIPLTGGNETLRTLVPKPGGGNVWAWTTLPTATMWAGVTAAWLVGGGVGLWLVAGRRRGA